MYTVTFGDKNSYEHWGLILTEKSLPFPASKTLSVEAHGIDGVIDLTEHLTGTVQYQNRKLSFSFTLIGASYNWADLVSEIAAYLHGKKLQITTSFDAMYYYVGRCSINDFKTDQSTATIVIDCDCEPYKRSYNGYGPENEWLWGPFDFEHDEINYLGEIVVNETVDVTITGEEADVVPVFLVSNISGPATALVNGITYTLKTGKNRFPDIRIGKEPVDIQFTGNFIVVIDYQGRRL